MRPPGRFALAVRRVRVLGCVWDEGWGGGKGVCANECPLALLVLAHRGKDVSWCRFLAFEYCAKVASFLHCTSSSQSESQSAVQQIQVRVLCCRAMIHHSTLYIHTYAHCIYIIHTYIRTLYIHNIYIHTHTVYIRCCRAMIHPEEPLPRRRLSSARKFSSDVAAAHREIVADTAR